MFCFFVVRFKIGVIFCFLWLEVVCSDKMWYECLNLNELIRLKLVRENILCVCSFCWESLNLIVFFRVRVSLSVLCLSVVKRKLN